MQDVEQIAIIGTGLLGASVGLGLKASGFGGRVVGVGPRRATLETAKGAGAIDTCAARVGEVLRDTQLVVVAVPLGAFDAVLADIGEHDHDKLVITDVGSTKGSVVASAHRHLPDPRRFCGSHPMAGSERQGPEAASAALFRGKPCVITPDGETADAAVARVEALWTRLGMHLLRMTPAEHDRKTAVISHLPHALAVLLMNVVEECGGLEVASTGLFDTSRLASSNPPMRADILTANREAIGEALGAFARHLDTLRSSLASGSDEVVFETLRNARRVRERWLQDLAADERLPTGDDGDA